MKAIILVDMFSRKKQILTKITFVIITLVLSIVLLSQIKMGDVLNILTHINPISLLPGFGLYILTYYFRALRFHVLLNRKVKVKDLFTIICIQNMANSTLPARTGELSYVFLLKKFHNKAYGEGAATLIISRVFDISAITGLFLVSALLTNDLPDIMKKAILGVCFLMVLAVLVLVILIKSNDRFIRLINKISLNLKINKEPFIVYLMSKLKETADSFSKINRNQAIWAGLLSVAVWILLYSVNYVLANVLGINVGFWAVLLASTFAMLTTILPIQGIGGFGTLESGWALGFIALGISKEIAISSGFIYHISIYTFFLTLGLYGIIMLKFHKEPISWRL